MHKKLPGMLKPDVAWAMVGKKAISRRAFYNAINRGEIVHQRLGHRILIPTEPFLKWMEGARRGEQAA